MALRVLQADNPGPFTLEGTRSHVVGRRRVAVIDPGPDQRGHLDALADAVANATEVVVVLTHGHDDHAGGAPELGRRLGAPVLSATGDHPLGAGDAVATDAGDLVVVPTPGHTRDHLAFHWPAGNAVFVGDLVLGRGDTTWVGEYPGCVADYLESLRRVRALGPAVLYPAHGPDVRDVDAALDRFERHRRGRVEQVERLLRERPDLAGDALVDAVYGTGLDPSLRPAARASVEAVLDYVGEAGGTRSFLREPGGGAGDPA